MLVNYKRNKLANRMWGLPSSTTVVKPKITDKGIDAAIDASCERSRKQAQQVLTKHLRRA